MTMFTGDIGDYVTPDGRVVKLRSDLAARLVGVRPVLPPPPGQQIGPMPDGPPGVLPGGPFGGTAAPDPMTPLPLSTGPAPVAAPLAVPRPAAPAAPAPQGPQPGQSPPNRPTRGPVTDPGQATDAGPPNTPGQRQLTDSDLLKMGVSGPANESIAASQEKQAAIERKGQALADQATQVGNAMASAEDVAARRLEEQRAEVAKRQSVADADAAALRAQVTKIANTKIDRTADHPILSAVGIALATLGTAMQNRDAALAAAFRGQPAPAPVENPGLKAFYASIDRKVAAQMQDLDQQRGVASLLGTVADQSKTAVQDRLVQMNTMRAGYLEQGKLHIDTIAKQTESPIIKENAAIAKADVDREIADTMGTAQSRVQAQRDAAAARAQAAKQHADTIGVQLRGQNLQNDQFYANLKAQQEEKMAAVAERMLEKGDAASAKRAKDAVDLAIYDPRSDETLLDPNGRKKFSDADRFEAAARQTDDPALAQKQRKYAADLRDSARINDSVKAPDKATADKLRPQMQAFQEVTDEIGTLRKTLETDPSSFNREQWAGISTRLSNVANLYQKAIGERVSPLAFDKTMKHVLEFDPESLFDRAVSQGKALESLKALQSIVANSAGSTLKAQGVRTDWVPAPKGEGDVASFDVKDKTAYETGQADNPGWLQRVGGRIFNPAGGYDDYGIQDRATLAAQSQPGSAGGLSPNATIHIQMLAKKADEVGDAERSKIVEALKGPIVAGNQDGGRSSVARGILDLLRERNPKLYNEVVASLPKDQVEDIQRIQSVNDRLRVNLPPPSRKPSGFDPDAAEAEALRKREDDARAALQRGGPYRNSPGAGTP